MMGVCEVGVLWDEEDITTAKSLFMSGVVFTVER